MKLITAVVKPFKLDEVKDALKAAGVAGILKFADDLPEGEIVCTVTGHGLKDPDTAADQFTELRPVAPHLDAVLEQLGW